MQNTVYSLVCEYQKTISHFKFHSAGINLIGQFVAIEWRQQGGTMQQLDVVQSIEPGGTFMVYEYPTAFVPKINEVIQRYVNMCIMPKKKKTIIEKPAPSRPVPDPISSSLPPKKTRTRKPIQKPHFSGKPLLKK